MRAKSGTKPIDHGHMGPGYSRGRKLPRARRLAGLLREKRGLTRGQVAGRLGVRLEAIAEMEDWGDVRCVGWDVSSGDGGLIRAQEVIDRYVDLLKPVTPEEERTLRDDRFNQLVRAMLAFEELMETTGWEPSNKRAPAGRQGPARSTTRRRKARSSRPRLSTLDAIGAPTPRICQVGDDGVPKATARIKLASSPPPGDVHELSVAFLCRHLADPGELLVIDTQRELHLPEQLGYGPIAEVYAQRAQPCCLRAQPGIACTQ